MAPVSKRRAVPTRGLDRSRLVVTRAAKPPVAEECSPRCDGAIPQVRRLPMLGAAQTSPVLATRLIRTPELGIRKSPRGRYQGKSRTSDLLTQSSRIAFGGVLHQTAQAPRRPANKTTARSRQARPRECDSDCPRFAKRVKLGDRRFCNTREPISVGDMHEVLKER